ncbi:hypothetical protein PM082_015444 [Marasmius tenuissimus]|nr:hypothetical protein PM082_015444 [Marasmius tenuissimus]
MFPKDPATYPQPAYLFILPLHTKLINGLHCVCCPFSQSIFYWSSDPHGRDQIAKEDWERLGIPELSVQELIGSLWFDGDYATVQEVLHWTNHDLDGKQYARDHGYPELLFDSKLSDRKAEASRATGAVESSGEWDLIEREEG